MLECSCNDPNPPSPVGNDFSIRNVLCWRGDKDYVYPSKRNVTRAWTCTLPCDGASCSNVSTFPGIALAHAGQHGLTGCQDLVWELTESGRFFSEQGNCSFFFLIKPSSVCRVLPTGCTNVLTGEVMPHDIAFLLIDVHDNIYATVETIFFFFKFLFKWNHFFHK